MLPSVKVSPPRIAESAVHMECELDHLHPVTNEKGEVTATLCILRAVMIHANNEVFGTVTHPAFMFSITAHQFCSQWLIFVFCAKIPNAAW
eukprot:SAG31_NODE_381_length_16458_cov_18.069259_5_plen_91_part_00